MGFYSDSVVSITINNIPLLSLLDTGASCNVMCTKLFHKCFPEGKQIETSDLKFTVANGDKVAPKGKVTIAFTVDKRLCTAIFYIIDTITHPIILGRDFLSKYGATLDFASNTLHLGSIKVRNSEKVKLAPNEICILRTHIDDESIHLPTGLHVLVEPSSKPRGLQILSSTSTVGDNSVLTLVRNIKPWPLKIKKGTSLTSLTPISSNDIDHNKDVPITTRHNIESDVTTDCSKQAPHTIDACAPVDGDVITDADASQQTHSDVTETGLGEDLQTLLPFRRKHKRYRTPLDQRETLPFDLSKAAINDTQKEQVLRMLNNHYDCFVDSRGNIGHCTKWQHEIQLKPDAVPRSLTQFKLSPMLQDKLQEQIDRMMTQRVLEIAETPSVWNSPVMCVPKQVKRSQRHMRNVDTKGVCFRPVIDFRYINTQIMTKRIQIPCMTTLIDTIAQKKPKLLSVCDIKDSFFNFELHPNSRPLTQFTFRGITYQFQRLPQGAADSPFVNQFYVSRILQPILNKTTLVYVDDCITYSKDFDSHLADIDEMLTLLEEAGLKLSPSKCEFFRTEVTYLGFELSGDSIRPNETHGAAMASHPTPKNKKQLKTFIGACLFLKSHIPDRGPLLKPLMDLTAKSAVWEWTDLHDKCFNTVRRLLASRPILKLPDWDKPFEIVSDASDEHCGVALLQRDEHGNFCPISYNGRSFRGSETRWDTHTKEAYGMIFAVTTYRHYLLHKKFTVWTDNSAVSHIFGNRNRQNARVLRWQLLLSEYDFTIKHLKGEHNGLSDALSRIVHPHWSPADNKIRDFPHVPGTDTYENMLTSHDDATHPQIVTCDGNVEKHTSLHQPLLTIGHEHRSSNSTYSQPCLADHTSLSSSCSSISIDMSDDEFLTSDPSHSLEPTLATLSNERSLHDLPNPSHLKHDDHFTCLPPDNKATYLSSAGLLFTDPRACETSSATLEPTRSCPELYLTPLTRAQTKKLATSADVKHSDDLSKHLPFVNEDELEPDLFQHQQKGPRLPHSKASNRKTIRQPQEPLPTQIDPPTNDPNKLNIHTSPLGMFDTSLLKREQRKDEYISDIIKYLQDNILPPSKHRQLATVAKADYHCIIDDILYNTRPGQAVRGPHNNLRLVVPSTLVPQLLHNFHDSVTGSHTGIARMITNIQRDYHFPKMTAMISRHVQSCHACNLAKSSKRVTAPRSIHDYSDVVFTYQSVDALGPLDCTAKGNRYIIVVTCHTSSYVVAWPQKTLSADCTIPKMMDNVFNIYGAPNKLLSDNGSPFNSHLWADMCKIYNIYMAKSSVYRPLANSKVERMNRTIGERLRALVLDHPKRWDQYLSSVILSINNSFHSLDNITPANIVFGRDIVNPLTSNMPSNNDVAKLGDVLAQQLQRQQYAIDTSRKLHFERALKLQAKHNANLKPSPFMAGDVVYYFKDGVKTALADPLQSGKFKVRYTGPYIITNLHSNNTCDLRNLSTGKFLPHRVNRDKLKRPAFYRLLEGTLQHKNAMDALQRPYYSDKSNVRVDNRPFDATMDFLNPRFGTYDPHPFVKVQ